MVSKNGNLRFDHLELAKAELGELPAIRTMLEASRRYDSVGE